MNARRISAAGVAVLAAGGLTGATLGSGENLGWVPQTVTVEEDAGHVALTIKRDMCQAGRVRVVWWAPWDVTADTASPNDYQGGFGDHLFPKCDTGTDDQTTVTIPIVDDDSEEDDEQFSVGLRVERVHTNDTHPLPEGGARQAAVVIRDDDRPRIRTQDVTVAEADGVARVAFRLEGLGEPTSVDVRTFDGTAKAGEDYAARDDSVRVEADGRGTVDIPVTADDDAEGPETFQVSFGWGEELERATVTITDPPPPTTETNPPPVETTPTTPTTPTQTTATTPAPAPQPASQQTQRSASLPPAKCVSRRRFSISLGKYRSASVKLDGAQVKTVRRGGKLVAQVDLRGRPKGEFSVTISGRAAKGGAKRSETRRYRTCTPRKRTTSR